MTENTKNKNEVTITRDMIIGDIIQAKPESINILMMSGMGCIACPTALYETLEEACMVHGMDPDYMLEQLNS